jgi:tetratricopeptide (TPR) repeat protein
MNQRVAIVLILALAATMAVWAQRAKPTKPAQPAQAAESQTPVAKQPQAKSKGEAEALMAVFNAQDPDTRLKAIETLLSKFNDTEFKAVAMQLAAATYQQKNDFDNMVIWAERTLEADPNSFAAMLMLATGIASRTREFDLDREEKLARAEKYARTAEEVLKTALKPNPSLTDEQWEAAKKDIRAQAHEALAMAAIPRKKYDVAIAEFRTAVEMASTPDPTSLVRLGLVYNMAGKYDEAIATLDKVMTAADVPPQIKQYAQAERVRAIQNKAAGAKPAAPPAAAAPPQVEIKKP